MPKLTKFNSFVASSTTKQHNLATDALTVALCAAANVPLVTNTILTDLTQIAYTNLSSRTLVTSGSIASARTFKLIISDLLLTAGAGTVATFRYVVVYNNTSATDLLIGFYDIGSNVVLLTTETHNLTFEPITALYCQKTAPVETYFGR